MTPELALEDIILPAPISAWPPAYGWWILAALLIATLLFISFKLYVDWQKKRTLELAKQDLWNRIQNTLSNDLCASINEWLKIQARNQWPEVMNLHGYAWIEFLNSSAEQTLFRQHHAMALAEGPYIPNLWASRIDLHKLALEWFLLSGAYKTYKRAS